MILALAALAHAWDPSGPETLRYVAEWMGIEAGVAEAATVRVGDRWQTTVTTRSAAWLSGLYPIDDRVQSTWSEAGSHRYETRFREGHFQQDQTMEFGPERIEVARRQLLREGWRSWGDSYPAEAGVLDPVSALLALRAFGEGDRALRVFSGKAVETIHVGDAGLESVEGRPARRFELRLRRQGVLQDRITAWVGTDAARVPVRAVVHTRAGPVSVLHVPGA